MRKVLKRRRGSGFPLVIAVTFALLMIMCVTLEYFRLNGIAKNVKSALQTAVISVINDNYDDAYHSVREGYSAGYVPANGEFEQSIDYGDVYEQLDKTLNLKKSGIYHIKYAGETADYKLYGLSVDIKNTDIAPSLAARQVKAYATVYVEIPVSFCGKAAPMLRLKLKTSASYVPIF